MFDEVKPPFSIIESIENQDDKTILSYWQQGRESQQEIANNLYLITDNSAAQILYDFLSERYQNANDIEQKNIIVALDNLGARNLPIEINTTNYLTEIYNEHNASLVIRALKDKVTRSSLVNDGRELSARLPVISAAGQLFIRELENADCPHEIRLQILAGIYDCQLDPDLSDQIQGLLNKFACSTDEKESLFAIGEMISTDHINHEAITNGLIHKFESGWLENADEEDLVKIFIIAGHNGDTALLPYLIGLKDKPDFAENKRLSNNLNWAIQYLETGVNNEA